MSINSDSAKNLPNPFLTKKYVCTLLKKEIYKKGKRMASTKFKKVLGIERGHEDGFGGIDMRAAQTGGSSLAYLANLDISSEGSLQTRRGYREKLTLSAPLRTSFSSGKKFFALAGNTLSVTDTETGITETLATTDTDSGCAEILFFGGDLYIHDSLKLYRYDGHKLAESDGYAPLYGKAWHPTERGPVYEDINLACDRIRISYLTAGSGKIFDLGMKVKSLDRVEINGIFADIEEHGIVLNEMQVDFTKNVGFSDGQFITFWLTLDSTSSKRHLLSRPQKSFVFSNSGGERLCLYSPGESSELLCSRAVTDTAIFESRKTSPESTALYLPLSSSVHIAGGRYAVNCMAHHFDRAILFTDANAWCVDFEGKENDPTRILPKIFLLNSAVGSETSHNEALCDNDPLTYYRGKIFRWHSQSGVRDECSAELISDAISTLLPDECESISLLSVPHNGIVFINAPDDLSGSMIIYNTHLKSWYTYSGVFPDKLFLFGTSPAFSRGDTIYVFSENTGYDIDDEETVPIRTKLVSHFTDFGCPEKYKRSAEILLSGDISGGVSVEFENERREKRKITLSKTTEHLSERIALPRFRCLRYIIEGISNIRLENIILTAK